MKKWIVVGLVLIFAWACKKDKEDPVPCTPDREFKRTEFTLQPPANFPPFPKETVLTEEIVSLGRSLFYEKKLSGDGTQSCASCHHQKDAFTDEGKRFSVGIDGSVGDMNSMALINLNYGSGFFWDGRSATMEIQAIEPVINPIEMHNTWVAAINVLKGDLFYTNAFYTAFGTDDWDSTHAAEAIAQFEKTMLSGNSGFDKAVAAAGGINGPVRIFIQNMYGEDAARGYDIFNNDPRQSVNDPAGGDCFHCHNVDNMLFTDNQFRNNGLDANPKPGLEAVTGNPADRGKFKVTTLRNIALTGPYMHDGRIPDLDSVINFYDHGVKRSPTLDDNMNDRNQGIVNGLNLTEQEKAQLKAFLEILTDQEFIDNPAFANPN